MQTGNKYHIQNDIADRGQHKQDQRRSAVAHGIEDTRTHVIDKQEQQTKHIHAQIQRTIRKDILRRGQRVHDAVRTDGSDQRQQQRYRRGGEQCGRDGGLHAQIALCAEQLRDEYAGTDVDTGCDRNEQLRDRVTRADSGQRQLTGFYGLGKTAYDDGVSHLVQLLERNAEQQRNREPEQLLRRFSDGKVSGQMGYLLSGVCLSSFDRIKWGLLQFYALPEGRASFCDFN